VALAGAVPATILLGLANELIRWLVAGSSLAALYGAAGSMIIFLLWVYYSAWVFLFGAEFSRAWSTGESSGGVEVPSRPTRT
jgi:membrane protein